jgi:3-dehydroquinate dehydratase-2
MLPILVLNGPNLNMLGVREPDKYGHASLQDVEILCQKTAVGLGLTAECRQSNLEGELVTWIQQSRSRYAGIIINAGGYSHSSVAILDALTLSGLPVIEVHITNIYAREEFRHHSVISKIAKGVICGLGIDGYRLAMQAMVNFVQLSNA